jgi:hypothetical protein
MARLAQEEAQRYPACRACLMTTGYEQIASAQVR